MACCTLRHVPDGLARRSYLLQFHHRQRPQARRRWLRVVVLPPETESGHEPSHSSPAASSFDASLPTVSRANENNEGDTNGGRSRRSDLRVPQMPRDGCASFQRRIGRRRRKLNRHPRRKKGPATKRAGRRRPTKRISGERGSSPYSTLPDRSTREPSRWEGR